MYQLELQTPGFHPSVISFGPGEHRIGRNPENDHCLDDPTVSSHHCVIRISPDRVIVRDLQSTNGTFIDGLRVLEEALLSPGQILRLGSVDLRLALEARVAIPDLPPVEDLHPVLPDGARACPNHRSSPATLECTKCGKAFCDLCAHQVRLIGGKGLVLCPACSGHCRSIPSTTEKPARKGTLATWISKLTVALSSRPPRKEK